MKATCYCVIDFRFPPVKAKRCCVAVFAGTTGEVNVLLRDSFTYATDKGDMLLCGRFAYASGEGKCCVCVYNWRGDVLLRGCFCMVLVRATRCCVTVFACTSDSGNLLLWYTIMEGITCCEILFMKNKLEFLSHNDLGCLFCHRPLPVLRFLRIRSSRWSS